jgi:hypothetical protein
MSFLVPVTASDIQNFSNPLPITSGKISCQVLIHWDSSSTLGFFIFHTGVTAWPLPKNHSEYNSFKQSLKGLLTVFCSCEVIPPGMTTRPVSLHELHV